MISDSQFYVVDVGKTVTMECSFHADHYRLFDTPAMWRKRQLDDNLPINMLSSINEPFVTTGRFDVEFSAAEPRYQLPLSISGRPASRLNAHTMRDKKNFLPVAYSSHSATWIISLPKLPSDVEVL